MPMMALYKRMIKRSAKLKQKSTEKCDGNEGESHNATTSVGSPEGISKSSLGAESDSVVSVSGNHHADGTAADGCEGSNEEGESSVSSVEGLHSAVNDEEHDTDKDDTD